MGPILHINKTVLDLLYTYIIYLNGYLSSKIILNVTVNHINLVDISDKLILPALATGIQQPTSLKENVTYLGNLCIKTNSL